MMDDTRFLDALRQRHRAGEPLSYLFFWGHRPGKTGITATCFSQWYAAPFVVDGRRYATAEHFMMAEKAALFGDDAIRARVLEASTPAEAKALGRRVKAFDDAVWTAHRYSIVVRVNEAKFAQQPDMRAFLASTGSRIIVEASPVDRIWGIGLAKDDPRAADPDRWDGLNLLGFALMDVRERL